MFTSAWFCTIFGGQDFGNYAYKASSTLAAFLLLEDLFAKARNFRAWSDISKAAPHLFVVLLLSLVHLSAIGYPVCHPNLSLL